MTKLDFRKLDPAINCPTCGINCWAETDNKPAIWPCGVPGCPYPQEKYTSFESSMTGTSLGQIIYSGS